MFGNRFKELRKSKGYSQYEMGKRINLSQTQVSHIETERNEPDIKAIKEYAKYFNISADYIIGLIDEKKPLYGQNKQR